MNERIEKLLEQVQVNEQVRRLAEQAGCTIDRLGYGEGNLEKFAELIVRDCRDMFVVNSPSWNLLNEKLEHFGVEE